MLQKLMRFLVASMAAPINSSIVKVMTATGNSGTVFVGVEEVDAEDVGVDVGVVDDCVTVNCVCVEVPVDSSVTVNP